MSLNLINSYMKFASGGAAGAPFYEILAQTKLTGTSDTIECSFTAKENLLVLCDVFGADTNNRFNFNDDFSSTENNYNRRYSANFGASTSNINQDKFATNYDMNPCFNYLFIENASGQEKIFNGGTCETNQVTGNTAAFCMEYVGKWVKTDQINKVTATNTGSGSYAIGSELIVMGYDNDGASGDTGWEELKITTVTGSPTDNINSGAFTAKRYLLVVIHCFASGTGGISGADLKFNSTASGYNRRYSTNFAAGATGTSEAALGGAGTASGTTGDTIFGVWLISNNDGAEKLCIGDYNYTTPSASDSPNSRQIAGKWTGTDQITNIEVINNGGGSFDVGSTVKIFGFT
jgi:hypothetical protein